MTESYQSDRENNNPSDDRKTALVKEAKKRWQRCDTWESNARKNWLEDYKFCYADSYNMYQWPQNAQTARGFGTGDEKPCLTVNKTKQHVLQIVNDMRQNKTSVKVKPVGNEATYEAAQVYEGAIRAIEYRSNAQAHYITATKFQVISGLGYLKVKTAYVDDATFDQELLVEALPDPLMVFFDPDSVEPDGRDARFAFEYTDMPRDEFDIQYPAWKDRCAHVALENMDGWIDEKHVRVAGYWYRNEVKDKLIEFTDPKTGAKSTIKKSETRGWTDDLKEALEEQLDDPETRVRDIIGHEVKWCRIIGNEVAEEKDWPGSTIPIVPIVGEKTVIDGEMDRRGHVRSMLDAQRMLNYNRPLDLNTPLPTPTGWTTVGEVRVGDMLFDENGQSAKVLGLSPTFLFQDCYRVEFDDGSHIVADGRHEWMVEEHCGSNRGGNGINWQKKTITTPELTPKKHFIYATAPLDLPEASLPIDPYVLGVWLGDGDTNNGRISMDRQDSAEMCKNLEACGRAVNEAVYDDRAATTIRVYGLTDDLTKAGLRGRSKRIPREYLRASRVQRLALFQGLMDTDGCFNKAVRQCIFTTVLPGLAEDFAELARSLGVKATKRVIGAYRRVFPGSVKECECQEAFRFHFTAYNDTKVFRLSRKSDPQQVPRQIEPRRVKRHRIKSVTPVPWVPTRCLAIDTPTHLFLAGEGMIPTHNSASIEYGALQTKTPWLAGAMAIEGQDSWASNNLDNFSVIVFNDRDDEGQPIAPPTKLPPPTAAPVYIQGAKDAADDMMAVSGQYQPVLGEPSNERSGKAIQERQRQGENATYHFIDHQAIAIRRIGEIIIEVYPKIYDTKRLIKIMGEDGSDSDILLDPDAKQAYEKRKAETDEAAEQVIMNPTIGKYDVISDVGPDFATRRQQAFDALSAIAAQDPALMSIIGDLVMLAADFPLADEAAERLRRMVPPQALGTAQNPQVLQLQAQLASMGKLNEAMTAKLIEKQTKMVSYQEKRGVDEYKAVTERMKVIFDHYGIPASMQMDMLHELAVQEHQAGLGLVDKTVDASLQSAQNDTAEAA